MLAGWGRSLLASGGARYSGLQFIASLLLLFQTIRYIWTLWYFRSVDWPFGSFVLALLPMLLVAVAAHVISIPATRDETDSAEVYFARARPFFLLQVGIMLSWSLYDLVNLPTLREAISDQFNAVVFVVRGIAVPAFFWLAYTKRPTHHWVILSVGLIALAYFSLRSLPVLQQ